MILYIHRAQQFWKKLISGKLAAKLTAALFFYLFARSFALSSFLSSSFTPELLNDAQCIADRQSSLSNHRSMHVSTTNSGNNKRKKTTSDDGDWGLLKLGEEE